MGTDTRPIYGTVALLGALLAALLAFQPYTAEYPRSGYTGSARRYIRAALREDSLALARLSTSDAAVRWALSAARHRRDTLALWARRAVAFAGPHLGDTTEVFVYPPVRGCDGEPIVLRFVGSGSAARVVEAASACLGPVGR